jgi:ABC-2 type transport system ATP-binding protein
MLALRVQGLRKSYKDVVAVDGLDLEVRAGECFGLLGPNGAGKTTAIEICEVEETVRLFRSFFRRGPAVDAVVAMVQLGEKRIARVGQLSGGQKQRLALACALVGDPELLFLDEPTTGLDPQSRRQLWELIEHFKSAGRTIVLTTHYMDEAERLCDRVAVVDHGRVIALGTPRALIASLGAAHVIEFAVGGAALDGGFDAALTRLAGVRSARRRDGTYRLQVDELHTALPALLDEVERRGAPLTELTTHSATLEDVFVALTGRSLRDA